MSLVADARELVPGTPLDLAEASARWSELAALLATGNPPLSADAVAVSQALGALGQALTTLQARARELYAEVHALGLPDRVLFGDPELLRSTVATQPHIAEQLGQLVERGVALHLDFVDAQHDFIDVLQPIAERLA